MIFARYGAEAFAGVTFEELEAIQREDRVLWANVENSGSEGVYLEVARWNMETHRWERFCFEKFENPKDKEPHRLAKLLNSQGCSSMSVIHVMPNYVPERVTA